MTVSGEEPEEILRFLPLLPASFFAEVLLCLGTPIDPLHRRCSLGTVRQAKQVICRHVEELSSSN